MTTPAAPTKTPLELRRDAEDAYIDVTPKLALLERFAYACSLADFGGSNPEAEQECWRGIEWLLRSIREDVDVINAAAEAAPQTATGDTR